eukprot:GHVS01083436.1.p1 GENE.GHVS01083436.1~~GHVS01083436.1.p1  ORF type:complete len:428 (+),score=63.85 GHVS01083436.1:377-1660(+)
MALPNTSSLSGGEMEVDSSSFQVDGSTDGDLTASLLINDEVLQEEEGLAVGADDFALDLLERDESDDLFLYREGRAVGYFVHVMQWCLFVMLIGACVTMLYYYPQNITRECDLHLKIWSLVWLSRALIQTLLNLTITRQRLTRQPVSHGFFVIVRFLHMFGIAWAGTGIYIIFYAPHCEVHESQASLVICKTMFWITAAVIVVPIALYILLLLCFPLLIYFLVRFSVPHADRQPTPAEVLSQLEVKTFHEVVTSLRTQYNIEPLPRGVTSTFTNVLDNVSAMLVAPAISGTATAEGGRGSAVVDDLEAGPNNGYRGLQDVGRRLEERREEKKPEGVGGEQLQGTTSSPTITINRACPICMVDMDDGDEVMVMPCDARHFFHKTCVEKWLEGSQACPICRANIVTLLTGAPASPSETGGTPTSIEMRS